MHGHEAGGINLGAVVVALPLLVLGAVLFFQKTAPPIVSAVLVAAGVIVAIGSFTFLTQDDREHPHAAAGEAEPGYQDAVDAMCEARAADPAEASDLFFDRAHGPLHVLADEVASEDRSASATLLEAKQRVESSLEPEADRGDLSGDLDRLIEATVAALSVRDAEVEACA